MSQYITDLAAELRALPRQWAYGAPEIGRTNTISFDDLLWLVYRQLSTPCPDTFSLDIRDKQAAADPALLARRIKNKLLRHPDKAMRKFRCTLVRGNVWTLRFTSTMHQLIVASITVSDTCTPDPYGLCFLVAENKRRPKHGRLVVLYGVNNVGKSTQARRLTDWLVDREIPAVTLKYPDYTSKPTGPMINAYLRQGNPYGLSSREFQTLQAANRIQGEKKIDMYIHDGIWVVLEDYVGTSLAWSMPGDRAYVRELNSGLRVEDMGILLAGERFVGAVEPGHVHENNTAASSAAAQELLALSTARGWRVVKSDQAISAVGAAIQAEVESLIQLQ